MGGSYSSLLKAALGSPVASFPPHPSLNSREQFLIRERDHPTDCKLERKHWEEKGGLKIQSLVESIKRRNSYTCSQAGLVKKASQLEQLASSCEFFFPLAAMWKHRINSLLCFGIFKLEAYFEPRIPTPHPVLRDPKRLFSPQSRTALQTQGFRLGHQSSGWTCWSNIGPTDKVGGAKSKAGRSSARRSTQFPPRRGCPKRLAM